MPYSALPDSVLASLHSGDDSSLWMAAWTTVVAPIEFDAAALPDARALFVQIGACSHWLRPHQTRLTAAGGFAWPSGYAGGRFGRMGLPELDWNLLFRWDRNSSTWEPVSRFGGKRRLTCRIAVPARTARHDQAVVHVRWDPGTIVNPRVKSTLYYAFRRGAVGWACAASGALTGHDAA